MGCLRIEMGGGGGGADYGLEGSRGVGERDR